MQRLDAGDLERVGRFVAEMGAIEGDEPFPPAFLAALRRLVPCDSVAFCELDRIAERELAVTTTPDVPDAGEVHLDYWQARPITRSATTTRPRATGVHTGSPTSSRCARSVPAGSTPSGFDPRGPEPDHRRPRRAALAYEGVPSGAERGPRLRCVRLPRCSTSCGRTSRCATRQLDRGVRSTRSGLCARADAKRTRDPRPCRRGQDERRDRRAALDLGWDRAPAPREHVREARRAHEDGRRARRLPATSSHVPARSDRARFSRPEAAS